MVIWKNKPDVYDLFVLEMFMQLIITWISLHSQLGLLGEAYLNNCSNYLEEFEKPSF